MYIKIRRKIGKEGPRIQCGWCRKASERPMRAAYHRMKSVTHTMLHVIHARELGELKTLDGKLYFEAKKMLTCMITKGNYFLSKCKVKN
jgi:hypothetical protein